MVQSNVIGRTNVIEGYKNDTYSIGSDAPSGIQTVVVTMDATEIQALNATAIELLPAPPAGRGYAILGIYTSKGAAAYQAGAAVAIAYTDTGNTAIATIPVAHFTGVADSRWATRANLSGTPAAQAIPSNSVDISVGTAFTDNGADVTVTIRFIEVSI